MSDLTTPNLSTTESEEVIRCSCGSGEVPTWGPDPYAQDICGDHTDYLMCDICRTESSLDI